MGVRVIEVVLYYHVGYECVVGSAEEMHQHLVGYSICRSIQNSNKKYLLKKNVERHITDVLINSKLCFFFSCESM